MIIVVVAGGSGTRLWPLSQGDHPKHLLALTGQSSLLQNTVQRAKTLTDTVYVVTEASHFQQVAAQLPDLEPQQLIVEPGRRGTAMCIGLALAHLAQYHGPDEPVVFLHADHHIVDQEGFKLTVEAAVSASLNHTAIALIGLKPTYPSTGFGYIQTSVELERINDLPVMKVESFVEKPDYETAEAYLADGHYYWNLGLFASTRTIFAKQMADVAPDLGEAVDQLATILAGGQSVTEYYLSLPSQQIDYALIERATDLVMVPGNFDWADIGSFFDLHNVMRGVDGNALTGDISMINCEDSMIHGTNKPIIAIGLSGIIVVDTPEGLLVCTKEQSQLVGQLSKQLAQREAKL